MNVRTADKLCAQVCAALRFAQNNFSAPRTLLISCLAATSLALLPVWATGQERNWRDHLTPFQDPASTEPARLNESLAVPLPPDLIGSAPSHDADWACANRDNAGRENRGAWALNKLNAVSARIDSAQGLSRPVLSLPTAIHLALCGNPQVRASWSAIAQQAAHLGQAQSAYWPQLNAGMARQRSRMSYPDSPLPASTTWATARNATLSWRLWDFGARSAKVDAAQAQLNAALRTQDATVQKVLADVLHLYAQTQSAQERLRTQRTLVPLAARSVQAAERRQQGGAGSGNDTLQAKAAQARIQLEQSRSQGEWDKATAQLAYLLGLPAGTAFQLPAIDSGVEQSQSTGSQFSQALDEWLEHSRQSHPAIEAAKAEWQAAQASLKAVQSEGLPTLDFNLAHYRNGRPNVAVSGSHSRENVVGLTLSIPLFDGFSTTYKVRAAQALVEQKAIEYQAVEQQTLQELVQLHADAKASLNNLEMAQKLYAVATEAAQSTQRQYAQGASDIVQLNQSLSSLQQAQLELASSQAEWNRARQKLWLQTYTSQVPPY